MENVEFSRGVKWRGAGTPGRHGAETPGRRGTRHLGGMRRGHLGGASEGGESENSQISVSQTLISPNDQMVGK